MRSLIAVLTSFLLVATAAGSGADRCKAHAETRAPSMILDSNERCYCGTQLSNLTVTLPAGLRLEAVCGLHFVYPERRQIDLTKEKASLDTYTNGGSYPEGHVILSGTAKETITGQVSVEEGPAGDLWFRAKPNHEGPVFGGIYLRELDLGSDEDYKKLRAPKPNDINGKCYSAKATIRIRDPIVLLGQTDQAGTSAKFDLIRISKYQPCER